MLTEREKTLAHPYFQIGNKFMIDMQNSSDYRNIPIYHVGIKNVKHPINYTDNDNASTVVQTVANFSLFVNLPQEKKGTHMSRFLSLLYDFAPSFSMQNFIALSHEISKKLESDNSFIGVSFPFFYNKTAPVSKTPGVIDIDVNIEIENKSGVLTTKLSVIVPIKSLCPCSKAISEFGAHSQRGLISIHVWNTNLSIIDCINIAESAASSPIFSILKREDEKYVTELAYNNPRFVEDLVREAAYSLKEKTNITKFEVTAENFESIHNHNAWACVTSEDIK